MWGAWWPCSRPRACGTTRWWSLAPCVRRARARAHPQAQAQPPPARRALSLDPLLPPPRSLGLFAASPRPLQDNGGPEGEGYGGNNWPLRGGKSSNWEGGVRVNAFVTGGYVPAAKRGTTAEGLVAIEDWYATFCALAGANPHDPVAAAAKLPQPDGLNQWPYLSGANATPPRQYVYMGSSDASNAAGKAIVTGVLRNDGYKLLLGKLANNWWTGPVYPNSSTYPSGSHDCGDGCLFNVFTDPSEYEDIAAAHPQVVAELTRVATEYQATAYNPQRGVDDGEACQKAFNVHDGFWGPFVSHA
jgi:arylsulfatase B